MPLTTRGCVKPVHKIDTILALKCFVSGTTTAAARVHASTTHIYVGEDLARQMATRDLSSEQP
jgi:hypothetical protein